MAINMRDIQGDSKRREEKSVAEAQYNGKYAEYSLAIQNAAILNLVFEGGGAKGGAYGGALAALEELGVMPGVRNVAGSSAGGITAFLLAIGFPARKIQDIITNLNFEILLDSNSLELDWKKMSWMELIRSAATILRYNGLSEGKEFLKLIKEYLTSQGLSSELTFQQLHALARKPGSTLKDLFITATNYNTNKAQVFSWVETPDVSIADAVRATMSFPFVFLPHKIKLGDITSDYGDGGIKNNYPMEIFDSMEYLAPGCQMLTIKRTSSLDPYDAQVNPCTLGFRVDSLRECASILWGSPRQHSAEQECRGIHVGDISKTLLPNDDNKLYARYFFNTVQIPTAVGTLQFKLEDDQKQQLLLAGSSTTFEYFRLYRNHIPKPVTLARCASEEDSFWKSLHEDWDVLSPKPKVAQERKREQESKRSGELKGEKEQEQGISSPTAMKADKLGRDLLNAIETLEERLSASAKYTSGHSGEGTRNGVQHGVHQNSQPQKSQQDSDRDRIQQQEERMKKMEMDIKVREEEMRQVYERRLKELEDKLKEKELQMIAANRSLQEKPAQVSGAPMSGVQMSGAPRMGVGSMAHASAAVSASASASAPVAPIAPSFRGLAFPAASIAASIAAFFGIGAFPVVSPVAVASAPAAASASVIPAAAVSAAPAAALAPALPAVIVSAAPAVAPAPALPAAAVSASSVVVFSSASLVSPSGAVGSATPSSSSGFTIYKMMHRRR